MINPNHVQIDLNTQQLPGPALVPVPGRNPTHDETHPFNPLAISKGDPHKQKIHGNNVLRTFLCNFTKIILFCLAVLVNTVSSLLLCIPRWLNQTTRCGCFCFPISLLCSLVIGCISGEDSAYKSAFKDMKWSVGLKNICACSMPLEQFETEHIEDSVGRECCLFCCGTDDEEFEIFDFRCLRVEQRCECLVYKQGH